MNYLLFAVFAYFLNALAVTADKFLLKKFIPDPLIYVFYFSLVSALSVFLIPFTHAPNLSTFTIASLSTLIWTLGAYFMFKALQTGQVSRVIPIIGTLTPLILLIQAQAEKTVNLNQIWAVAFLLLGLILITLSDIRGKLKLWEFIFEILASLLFALSYILLRQAYLQDDFLAVFVYSRFILIPVGMLIFLIPPLRQKIFTSKGIRVNFKSAYGLIFFAGQTLGGASQLIITFSISLAEPALINSLQGVQYLFLLFFALILSRFFPKVFGEKFSPLILAGKFAGIILIFFGLFLIALGTKVQTVKPGLSYSPLYAYQMGLNPKTTFARMLDDLKVKTVRLPVYWDQAELFPNQLNFSQVDYYINEAGKRDVKIILVLGYKQPRWPECFPPYWVSQLTLKARQEKILELVEKEISHFKAFSNIYAWQVENEPFLHYGICDPLTPQTKDLLKKEVEIVKRADKRPVIITDSGELSSWFEAASFADIFGFTLYRQVWNPIFGIIRYPTPGAFYLLKQEMVKILNPDKQFIVSELQAEPWIPNYQNPWEVEPDYQAKLMGISDMAANLETAKESGASQSIIWGVEWWYFMADKGYPRYLEYAKTLF